MRYRTLGRTGLRVSEVGFGGAPTGLANYLEAWDAAGAEEQRSVEAALHRALDRGLNYIDTAPGYGGGLSEEVLGRVVGPRRDECIVATKTAITADRAAITRSVEESLRRLRVDVIDVVQFHGGWYPGGDVDAILGGGLDAYVNLKEQGKVRFLGFTAEGPSGGVSELIGTGAFDVLQARYNFMYQTSCDFVNETGIVREAKAREMGVVTMRTLTSGTFQKVMRRAFPTLADADLDGFLLNYTLSNPYVDVALVGMRRVEEVERNVAVSDDLSRRIDLVELHARYV